MSGKTEQERRAPITLAVVWKEKPTPKPKVKRKIAFSPEHLQRQRERMKLRWQDPEFRERHRKASSAANKARMADPEKKKIAVANFKLDPWRKSAICRLMNAKRFADPEQRRKSAEHARKLHAEGKFGGKQRVTPEGEARRNVARVLMHNKRRGFAIPKHLRRDYDNLVNIKKLKAVEAGIMLGIIKVAPRQSIATLEEYKVPKGELGTILQAVSQITGVSCQDIVGLSRVSGIVRARMVFYYVSKTYCRHSYPKIAEVVNRDHATVLSGCQKVKKNTEIFSPTIRRVLDLLSREDKLAA